MIAKKKKIRKKPSPEVLEQRAQKKEIRKLLRDMGFKKVEKVSDKEFTFEDATTDFDDVFVVENVILFLEYTITQTSNISEHLKKKKIPYDKITNNRDGFIEFFSENFSSFNDALGDEYTPEQYKVIILYCSKNTVEEKHKNNVPNVIYFDYPIVKYFRYVAGAIKYSARSEFYSFLGLKTSEIGENLVAPSSASFDDYEGSVLPRSHSNFDKGYKVVSFYIDPEALLSRCYVLRKESWREDQGLYQRMVTQNKISEIRKYLRTKKRVFINNIIVTLPSNTKIVGGSGESIDLDSIIKTSPATIQIPKGYNEVGLVDGQHRVFSYHKGGTFDDEIDKLRRKQNLLVTGIIYPPSVSKLDKTKFEANLFLEINSNQTNAKSDLKQAIRLILDPFLPESVAKAVISKLNKKGPLIGEFEEYFYETDKIKTTSIVSYGLKQIVKLSGGDSFYKLWKHPNKAKLEEKNDEALLKEYVDFCADHLNVFLIAVKKNISKDKWTTDKSVKGRVLTTTAINGFIICFRKLIENKKPISANALETKLKGINSFKFEDYHSSQYGRMSDDLYDRFFK